MKYEEIVAESEAAAYEIAKKKLGGEWRLDFVEKQPVRRGFLGRKKLYTYVFSILDEDYDRNRLKDLNNNKAILGLSNGSPQDEALKLIMQHQKELRQDAKRVSYSKSDAAVLQQNSEIRALTDNLNKVLEELKKKSSPDEISENVHPNIKRIQKILKENDFYDDFISEVVDALSAKLSFNELNDEAATDEFVYEYICQKLKIYPLYKPKREKSEHIVLALIGPTGIGKSTTIAKIAGNLVKKHISIELVSTDGYKIGGMEQMKRYAKILNVNFTAADDAEDFARIVAGASADYILVDTTGRGQKDEIKIVTMKEMLEAGNVKIQYLLAVSATTKAKDVKKIFKAFDTFDYDGVVITKTDESDTVGAILCEAISRGKGIAFYTNGQGVPNDLVKASHDNVMQLVSGLRYISLSKMQS